jgi:hypothetical protein
MSYFLEEHASSIFKMIELRSGDRWNAAATLNTETEHCSETMKQIWSYTAA